VGGFNETDLPIAFNDIDFCLRVRAAGYRNLWTPFAEFFHHESASRGKEDTPEKQARFANEVAYMRRTWGPMLDHDPPTTLISPSTSKAGTSPGRHASDFGPTRFSPGSIQPA